MLNNLKLSKLKEIFQNFIFFLKNFIKNFLNDHDMFLNNHDMFLNNHDMFFRINFLQESDSLP